MSNDVPHASREAIASAILKLCRERGPDKTICPSDAARAVFSDEAEWRTAMDIVRDIGAQLHACGEIDVLQRGDLVDPRTARGPIRYRISR